ncbi:MAG: hypothetical protein AAF621_02550 [Pseudomonadota bacterium]
MSLIVSNGFNNNGILSVLNDPSPESNVKPEALAAVFREIDNDISASDAMDVAKYIVEDLGITDPDEIFAFLDLDEDESVSANEINKVHTTLSVFDNADGKMDGEINDLDEAERQLDIISSMFNSDGSVNAFRFYEVMTAEHFDEENAALHAAAIPEEHHVYVEYILNQIHSDRSDIDEIMEGVRSGEVTAYHLTKMLMGNSTQEVKNISEGLDSDAYEEAQLEIEEAQADDESNKYVSRDDFTDYMDGILDYVNLNNDETKVKIENLVSTLIPADLRSSENITNITNLIISKVDDGNGIVRVADIYDTLSAISGDQDMLTSVDVAALADEAQANQEDVIAEQFTLGTDVLAALINGDRVDNSVTKSEFMALLGLETSDDTTYSLLSSNLSGSLSLIGMIDDDRDVDSLTNALSQMILPVVLDVLSDVDNMITRTSVNDINDAIALIEASTNGLFDDTGNLTEEGRKGLVDYLEEKGVTVDDGNGGRRDVILSDLEGNVDLEELQTALDDPSKMYEILRSGVNI